MKPDDQGRCRAAAGRNVSSLTKPEAVHALAWLSSEEEARLAPPWGHHEQALTADHPQNGERSIHLEPWRDRKVYRRIKWIGTKDGISLEGDKLGVLTIVRAQALANSLIDPTISFHCSVHNGFST
jgi:hypothetical protein